MSIFGKHIFRSIRKHPIEPIMIVFIVTLCVAVMILTVALPINIYANESAAITSDEWTPDYTVTMKASSDRRILFDDDVKDAVGDTADWIGEFSLTGFAAGEGTEKQQTDIGAFDLYSADRFFEIRYLEYGKFTNNNIDRSAIVSEQYAAQLGLSVGDTVTVNVLGEPLSYTVEGIAMNTGIFKTKDMLVDIGSIRQILAERSAIVASMSADFNPYTKIHLRLKSGVSEEAFKSSLEAREDFGDKKLEKYGNDAAQRFYATFMSATVLIPGILLVIVAAMMTVSTLELLEKRRQADNALFRIVGAEPRQLDLLVYLESLLYALVGGALGSALSVLGIRMLNGIFRFEWSSMSFGIDDAIVGIGSSVFFTLVCAYLHVRKQRRATLSESLGDVNIDTYGAFSYKKLTFGILAAVTFAIALLLPPSERFILALLMLIFTMVFIYVISPPVIGALCSLVSRLLERKKRGAGVFIIAAKNCTASYPLRHAGRVMTVLLTVLFSLTRIITTVDSHMSSYADFVAFDYIGMYVDDETKERLSELDGILAVSECSISKNVIFDGDKTVSGVSVSDFSPLCFNNTITPDVMPVGNEIALSRGVASLLGVKVGDTVECTVSDIPCTLVVSEIVMTNSDFAFYDADYVGSERFMTCIRTDGSPDTVEALTSLFDERGVECIKAEDFFRSTHNKVDSHLTVFSAMMVMAVVMTAIGVVNVLADQRIARKREFDIFRQNGITRGGTALLETVEIACLLISSLLLSAVLSEAVIGIVDMLAVTFGMTLYA